MVLYTGGTIGMVRNAEGALAPFPHAMEDRIRATITMHDEEYSKSRFMEIGAGRDHCAGCQNMDLLPCLSETSKTLRKRA